MFIISLNYTKSIEVIDSLLAEHIEFIKSNYEKGKFICTGRKTPRTGGVILSALNDEDEIWEILKQDPFYLNQACDFEVINFTPTRHDERFACFVDV